MKKLIVIITLGVSLNGASLGWADCQTQCTQTPNGVTCVKQCSPDPPARRFSNPGSAPTAPFQLPRQPRCQTQCIPTPTGMSCVEKCF